MRMCYIGAMETTSIAGPQDRAILEFDKIAAVTCGLCMTPMGAERIRERLPTDDAAIIDRRREEVQEMMTVLEGGDLPILRLPDLRGLIEKSGLEGSFLDPGEFLQFGEFLAGVDALLKFSKVSAEAFPRLEYYLAHLSAVYPLRVAIERSITPEAEVSDTASPELARIRKEKRRVRDRVVSRLERILVSRKTDPSRVEDIITLRNDRFVIPMRESDPAVNEGVIQDRSSSGATIFVEPMAVVESNNQLRRLGMEETREVERILLGLTDLVRAHTHALLDNVTMVGKLDAISAVGQFGRRVDGVVAGRSDDASLDLVEARHPLLVLKSLREPPETRFPVVPMSVAVGEAVQALIVTGPNTGGKTVSLKTIGLLTLMAQAGWPVPAKEGTRVGIFSRVIADIGDEQSIESSLSTFSSHLTRIRAAIDAADARTLVLLDELGAGTDPKEGAALGEAIVRELTERGARLVVTTHHSALKTLSQHDARIENASLVFDVKTLSPSYQFRVGLPGASYAIAIARRLGLSPSVITCAESLIGEQEKNLTHLLNELDDRLVALREGQSELDVHRRAAAQLEDLYRSRLERLKKTESERKSDALAEAEQIVAGTRREMEQLVREIREGQAERERVKAAHKILRDRATEIKEQRKELRPVAPPATESGPLRAGDRVWIAAFRRDGEMVEEDTGRGKVKVRIGDFLYTLDREAVAKAAGEASASPPKPRVAVHVETQTEAGPEISLRGQSVEDALEQLDRYLDDVRVEGLTEVRIVHGKGEGILRRAVCEFLTKDPRVVSKRLGQWNEGADGVTIAKLRAL